MSLFHTMSMLGKELGWRITCKAEKLKMSKAKGKARGSEDVFGGMLRK